MLLKTIFIDLLSFLYYTLYNGGQVHSEFFLFSFSQKMKKSRLSKNAECVKIKRELENLVRDSKYEYQSASTHEKEAFQVDLGLQPKSVPTNVILKGNEVLDVSGTYRRGSPNVKIFEKTTALKYSRTSSASSHPDISNELNSKDQTTESSSLNVVMKGESVLKNKKLIKKEDEEIREPLEV